MSETALEIRAVSVREHYVVLYRLMEGLQAEEQAMFHQSAAWADIGEAYLRHVIRMQEEAGGTCLLALADGAPAGFVFGYLEEEEGDSRIEVYQGPVLYVSDGYVAPYFRRRGIYRALNRALEAVYIPQGVRRILRFTLSGNKRMQGFLEGEGYRPVRLLYEKWLNEAGDEVLPLGLHTSGQ